MGNRIVTSATVTQLRRRDQLAAGHAGHCLDGVTLDPTATQQGVTSFLNGFNTLTQGVDFTVNYPTDFGDYGLVDWTLAGNYNDTAVSRVAPTPTADHRFGSGRDLLPRRHAVQLRAQRAGGEDRPDRQLDAGRVRRHLPRNLLGPAAQHRPRPTMAASSFHFNQAGVGLTDMEAPVQHHRAAPDRVRRQQRLQHPPGCSALAQNGVLTSSTTALKATMRPAASQFRPAMATWTATIFGPAWNPNGGYYYGRISSTSKPDLELASLTVYQPPYLPSEMGGFFFGYCRDRTADVVSPSTDPKRSGALRRVIRGKSTSWEDVYGDDSRVAAMAARPARGEAVCDRRARRLKENLF